MESSYKLWKKLLQTDPCKTPEKKSVKNFDPYKGFEKNTNATENSVFMKALKKEMESIYQKTLKTPDPIKPSTWQTT